MYFFLFLQEAEEGWSGDQEARLRPLQVIASSFFATSSVYITASVANTFLQCIPTSRISNSKCCESVPYGLHPLSNRFIDDVKAG